MCDGCGWIHQEIITFLVIAVLGTMGENTALKITDPVSYANSRRKTPCGSLVEERGL